MSLTDTLFFSFTVHCCINKKNLMLVYYFNDFETVDGDTIELLKPLLPQEQQEAIDGTKLTSRKREIAVSHLMLAYAINNNRNEINDTRTTIKAFNPRLTQIPPTALSFSGIQFKTSPHGKPYITSPDGIFFNISHCKESIVVGVDRKEIGIDVEGRRRTSETLMSRAFNEGELQMIREAEDSEMEFARIWTRKESFFKWTGTGILIEHIKSVEEDAAKAHCTITTQQISPHSGNPFYLSIATKK